MDKTLELAVVREALQSRLLVELMGNALHKELVLKGGMAMRAVHGSVRYTKDIDLDADLKFSKARIQGIVKRSIEYVVNSGLIADAVVTMPKQTGGAAMTSKYPATKTHSAVTAHVQAGARGANWKFALLQALGDSETPRVLSAFDFYQFALKYRPGTTSNTARLVSKTLVAAGALARVSTGLFLNKRKVPSVELSEAAQRLRSGAIVSLHTVLGECGFLNNPSDIVVAVLPTSATKRPTLGDLKTSSGQRFRFYGLAEKFFPITESERWETLQPGRMCPTFRPEAALLQWLHLAAMKRSAMTPPPVDVDMDLLDDDLLATLASRWNLEPQLHQWKSMAQTANFGEDRTTEGVTQTVGPTSGAIALATEARARMLARKSVKPA